MVRRDPPSDSDEKHSPERPLTEALARPVCQPPAMSTRSRGGNGRSDIWVRQEGAPELGRRELAEQAQALGEAVRRPPAGPLLPGAAHAPAAACPQLACLGQRRCLFARSESAC